MVQFKYKSTKTYGHETGLSAAFRQWRALSHCSKNHGYPLSFKFEFGANELDSTNWVVDFGGLKPLKALLEKYFDHKTLVAEDDPHLEWFKEGEKLGTLDLVILPSAGCEKFAEFVFTICNEWFMKSKFYPRCTLISVEVREHGGNSSSFTNPECLHD